MEGLRRCLVLVAIVYLSLVNATNRHVIGWCCPARKGGGSGCRGAPVGEFQPPLLNVGAEEVSWKIQDLDCPVTSTMVYYDLNDDNGIVLLDQELVLHFRPGELFSKNTHEYCIEKRGEGYRGAVCQPDPEKTCGSTVCIPKCCGVGEDVIFEQYKCSKKNTSMSLHYDSIYGQPVPAPASVVIVGDMSPKCSTDAILSILEENEFYLLANGKMLELENQITHDFSHYCIEDSHVENGTTQFALVCLEPQHMAITVKYHLMTVGYVISAVFLLATMLFHFLIPSLRDIQGLCFLFYMTAMLVSIVTLFVLTVTSVYMSKTHCIFSAYVLQYSFLAMFFWLNIMCFDIWRVVRDTASGIPLRGILNNDAKKFRLYCLYGWGLPLVVTVATAVLHALPKDHTRSLTPPDFGKITCYLNGDMELLIYSYAYIAVLFILDLILLGHTMITLYQAGNAFMCFARQVSVTAFNRNHLEAFWQRFGLFMLMVFCWTTEILSWKIKPIQIWIVSDFVNSSQGLLVFILFIINKKRRDMIADLLKKLTMSCSRLKTESNSNTDSAVAIWHANLNSSSSGPSATTDVEITPDQQSSSKTCTSECK